MTPSERKTLWSKIGINVLFVTITAVIMVVFVMIWLRLYTRHGEEILAPNVTNMYVDDARDVLKKRGLRLQVLDSTHLTSFPLGMIIEQDPPANSHVKKRRSVYVIINASCKRQITLPKLKDYSLRQAQATLTALNLPVESIEYSKSEYKDLILDVQVNGESVTPGTKLPEGTGVTLVVGTGLTKYNIRVPNVKNKKIANAIEILEHVGLHVESCLSDAGALIDTSEVQGMDMYVFWQRPIEGSVVQNGAAIQLKVTSHRDPSLTATNKSDDEEFFD